MTPAPGPEPTPSRRASRSAAWTETAVWACAVTPWATLLLHGALAVACRLRTGVWPGTATTTCSGLFGHGAPALGLAAIVVALASVFGLLPAFALEAPRGAVLRPSLRLPVGLNLAGLAVVVTLLVATRSTYLPWLN